MPTSKAVERFAAWCAERGLDDLARVTPMHVAGYVEQFGQTHSKPTVKQHLAAIRMLFDWLVTGHIMRTNPAHAVRGPKHSVRKGKTSVLSAEEMHDLLAAIDTTSLLGLRDRALIALMGYTFARVGAATGMKVEDYYVQKRRGWVRLHEKGGKVTELPCHHNVDQYLEEWLAASRTCRRTGSSALPFPALRPAQRPHSPAPGQCAPYDPAQGQRREVANQAQRPQLPRHRHHHLPAERRQAGDRPADGRPRISPHYRSLRSAQR